MVRALHRVGANLAMIASALRLEGLQTLSGDDGWQTADIERIVQKLKKSTIIFPRHIRFPNDLAINTSLLDSFG